MKPDDLDVQGDVLILLADILGTCERVLGRAKPRDARIERIRGLARALEAAVLDHWADARAQELRDERQLDLDDLWRPQDPSD